MLATDARTAADMAPRHQAHAKTNSDSTASPDGWSTPSISTSNPGRRFASHVYVCSHDFLELLRGRTALQPSSLVQQRLYAAPQVLPNVHAMTGWAGSQLAIHVRATLELGVRVHAVISSCTHDVKPWSSDSCRCSMGHKDAVIAHMMVTI